MGSPNIDTNRFVPPGVIMKEIERAEKARLLDEIEQINERLEAEKRERATADKIAEKKNKARFAVGTIIGIISAIAAIIAAVAAVIPLV